MDDMSDILSIVENESDKVQEDFPKYYEFLTDWTMRARNEDVRTARMLALMAVMSDLADVQESVTEH